MGFNFEIDLIQCLLGEAVIVRGGTRALDLLTKLDQMSGCWIVILVQLINLYMFCHRFACVLFLFR